MKTHLVFGLVVESGTHFSWHNNDFYDQNNTSLRDPAKNLYKTHSHSHSAHFNHRRHRKWCSLGALRSVRSRESFQMKAQDWVQRPWGPRKIGVPHPLCKKRSIIDDLKWKQSAACCQMNDWGQEEQDRRVQCFWGQVSLRMCVCLHEFVWIQHLSPVQ